MFQGLNFTGKFPFKKVVIHGLIRDPQGRKMSKSLGNGVDPIDVVNQYGVDALRYFLTSNTTPGEDTRYSDEKLQASANYLNKIWNASRFILMNLDENDTSYDIDKNLLDDVDKFILTKLEETIEGVTTLMDRYDFANASKKLYNFVYDDFTSWYVELSKVKLNGEDKALKQNTLAVLIKVLKSIILMIYPYTPFIAEEIYLNLPGHLDSIMLDKYPLVENDLKFVEETAKVENLISAISDVRAYKVENNLAPNAKIKLVLVPTTDTNLDFFVTFLKKFTFAESIDIKNETEGAPKVYKYFTMLIQDNIDKSELIAKLDKEIDRLVSEVARCEKMLSNPGFISKAPEAKINAEKAKLADYKKELDAYLTKKASLK
jgi:valyl-tRNA synthetase